MASLDFIAPANITRATRLKYGNAEIRPPVGDVVIIKSVEGYRNSWPLDIIEELIAGHDQAVRDAKLRVGNSVLERPVQYLYPLELHQQTILHYLTLEHLHFDLARCCGGS